MIKNIKKNPQDDSESLTDSQREEIICEKLITKHKPSLIIIGANDLKAKNIKEKISNIASNIKDISPWVTFGDLMVPIIYSNSQISEFEFPNYNIFIRQAISLGRYLQSPLQEILQLWKKDLGENYCLKIKLHNMQN